MRELRVVGFMPSSWRRRYAPAIFQSVLSNAAIYVIALEFFEFLGRAHTLMVTAS